MNLKTKVLVISRDQTLVTLMQRDLNDGNYEVICTEHCGLQLKSIVDAEFPDFIILDVIMPSLDGIGTCLQLRQWTQTPIMMLSTWDTGDGKVRGLNLGCDSYLTEPFGIGELKSRIEDTLDRSTRELLSNLRLTIN